MNNNRPKYIYLQKIKKNIRNQTLSFSLLGRVLSRPHHLNPRGWNTPPPWRPPMTKRWDLSHKLSWVYSFTRCESISIMKHEVKKLGTRAIYYCVEMSTAKYLSIIKWGRGYPISYPLSDLHPHTPSRG